MNARIRENQTPENRPNLRSDDGTLFVYNLLRGVYEPYKASEEANDSNANLVPPGKRDVFSKHWNKHWKFWVTTLISVLTFLVVAIYTVFAGRQTTASEKATKATEQAAYAACESARLARIAIIAAESGGNDAHNLAIGSIAQAAAVTRSAGAIIKTSLPPPQMDPKEGDYIDEVTFITNIGKTPAKGLKIRSVTTILKQGEEPNFSYTHESGTMGGGILEPDTPIPISIRAFRNGYPIKISENEVRDFIKGNLYIVQYGRIDYRDIFGIAHWETFCSVKDKTVLGEKIMPSNRHEKCANYNNSDTKLVTEMSNSTSDTQPTPSVGSDIYCKKPE